MERLNSVVFFAVLALGGVWFVLEGEAGSVSATENRQRAAMPELTVDNMVGGVFSDGVEAFVADAGCKPHGFANRYWMTAVCLFFPTNVP